MKSTSRVRAGSEAGRGGSHPASGIALKIGLLLAVPFGGALVAVLVFVLFLAQSAPIPDQINYVGRQRMLALQLGDWADMVAAGQTEDRPRLRELVTLYDRMLRAFEVGGPVEGRRIQPLPGELHGDLGKVKAEWNRLRPRLLTVSSQPPGAARSQEAHRGLRQGIDALRVRSDELTSALVARVMELRRRMLWVYLAIAGLNLGLLWLGLWYARRSIIEPVLQVDEAAWRVSRGDYSVRLPCRTRDDLWHQRLLCRTRDELCHLSHTFNEMAEQVQKLLDQIDLRRKHAETLAESLPLGTVLLDERLALLRTNRSFREMFGLGDRDTRQRQLEDVLPLEGVAAQLRSVLETGGTVRGLGFDLPTPAGSRPLRITIAATRLAEGEEESEQARLLLVVEDLTEEERLRAEARASEASFRQLIEGSPDAIAVHRDGRFVYVNPALVATLGYASARDLLATPVLDIVHPDDRAAIAERIRSMTEDRTPAPPEEERFLRADGSVLTAEVVAMSLVFGGEPAIVAVARDLTERKLLAAKIMEMDRMIAVGMLAAGVGHEINNPLAYAIANLDWAVDHLQAVAAGLQEPPAGSRQAPASASVAERLAESLDVLREAREGTNRVRSIVRDLKTFSRADKEQRAVLDVRRVLDASISMTWNEIRHRARLEKVYDDIPPVDASEGRLGQVFVNLLVNAAQAIPEGAADCNTIRIRTGRDGDLAVVEIEDTGSGIAAEHLGRLFEPFFTTKPIGQGTGLGLAICRQTVEAHGGQIAVESKAGRGTAFRVTLPAAKLAEVPGHGPAAEAEAGPARRGRILVVDDEPLFAQVMRRILLPDHDVVPCTSAREARDLVAAGERFDLAFCDLMMPEMTGMDLHAEVLALAPELAEKMIFLSGGAFTPRARAFLDSVPNLRLDKPFDPKNLRALVRDLLR